MSNFDYKKYLQEGELFNEDGDWIQKAIKKPGALHRELGIPKDEDIPKKLINKDIKNLEKKDKEHGKLDPKELLLLRRLNLAKTLDRFNEEMSVKELKEEIAKIK